MRKIQMFESPEFGQVRTLTENGEVLFCGLDVAQALGYAKPHDALKRHCRYSVKRRVPHPQAADKQIEMLFIPEPDLYRLIFGSKLPTAEKFTDWVTKEILPAIRKTGVYMTDEALEAVILNPDTIIKLALELKAERNMRQDLEQCGYSENNVFLMHQWMNRKYSPERLVMLADEGTFFKLNRLAGYRKNNMAGEPTMYGYLFTESETEN